MAAGVHTISALVTYSRATGMLEMHVRHHDAGHGQRLLTSWQGKLPDAFDPEEVAYHALQQAVADLAEIRIPDRKDPWDASLR